MSDKKVVKENIAEFLDQLSNEDAFSAKETLSNIIANKVEERLDTMKVDVASKFFNKVE